ncbi:dioxygenase family protein [Microcoleus sp. K5-D4]|uniref:dioxygenase family protein n=1 Tax=Microcoleus sp. K5-D4 TaxID=2818801 RepID=UPI002FD4E5C5
MRTFRHGSPCQDSRRKTTIINHVTKKEFETVVPLGYKVPSSGPCGELLGLLGRHPWRAAHIYVKVSAPEYTPLTTQIFMAGDPHLDSDTTFAVRSAIVHLEVNFCNSRIKAILEAANAAIALRQQ